jgi:predicted dehydrogenase
MRIGIIGTSWGRLHCGTFRRHGHEIVALLGRDAEKTRRIAAEEGVPAGGTDPSVLEGAELIVVASPADTHAEYVARFAARPLFCEKPLFGRAPDPPLHALVAGARLWVSYAFGFLESAGRIRRMVQEGQLGDLEEVQVSVRVALGEARPAGHWLGEVAVHPLAFVQELVGPMTAVSAQGGARAVAHYRFAAGQRAVSLEVAPAAAPGIEIAIALQGTRGRLLLEGGYQPAAGWSFAPLQLNGAATGPPEQSSHADVWFEANCRCVGTMLDVLEGRIGATEAAGRGLFDGERALAVDAAVAGARAAT